MVWIGRRVGQATEGMDDFFLAGRKLGKVYQFFLNFGCSTNADQAVAVSREVYRQGIGGMWIQSLVLFLTPFYWFTVLFFRRVRLTTIGDYFAERFGSPFLGAAYAVFTLALSAFIGGGIGMLMAGKTMVAMTPKAIEQCTPAERASIRSSGNSGSSSRRPDEALTPEQGAGGTSPAEAAARRTPFVRLAHQRGLVLRDLRDGRRRLHDDGRVPCGGHHGRHPGGADHHVLGHPRAGRPREAGGFEGLHAAVPAHMFELFGSASLSEYAWYTVVAMVLANLVSIIAVVSGMQTAGLGHQRVHGPHRHDRRDVHQAGPDAVLGAGGPHRHRPDGGASAIPISSGA